jgi:hypothetical protein
MLSFEDAEMSRYRARKDQGMVYVDRQLFVGRLNGAVLP